ncbi:phospho-N-acetylmuramoyl-pentapeptide-transferase [Abditibacterium utsteinense]|nr:phospho-N-acetylmuramoyl-pentapeptide-transferase [Abditibacterium utsteinense]
MGYIVMLWGLSWALMLICGKPLITWLKTRKGMKWAPREDTPDSHLQKAGVPSMGGIGIIGAALVGFVGVFVFQYTASMIERSGKNLRFSEVLHYSYLFFPLMVLLHAVLGYIDDHSKATNRGGISSKAKLLGQIILAAAFLAAVYRYLVFFASNQGLGLTISVYEWPLFDSWILILGALLIIIGTSNAVNLTDGIDGLAAGLCVQVGAIFAVLSLETGTGKFNFFGVSAILFWLCLGGACLGFLAFNRHPAKVFMGDTGSLALGAALGAGAILTRTVWLLPFIGFIFYVEMFSVIFQVLYFKWTKKRTGEGKRIFRRAPLHHHFELGGWSEKRVVWTFWAINFCTSILGLILWKTGVLPRFP